MGSIPITRSAFSPPRYIALGRAGGHCCGSHSGDKIFVEWKFAGVMPACPGTERVVGGTGKYKGISGDQEFQGNFIGDTGAGWSDWSGEYKLP